jgi:hypothetical protein
MVLDFLLEECRAGKLKGFTGIVQLDADDADEPAIIMKVRSDIEEAHAGAAVGALEALKFDIMLSTALGDHS